MNYLTKILVTGGEGQVAQALRRHALQKNFELFFCSHKEMDIANLQTVSSVIQRVKPDLIVNTAAYTAVDKAESEQEAAMLANYVGAKNLAIVCQQQAVPFVQLSTDYVFDGTKQHAYQEEDKTNPINVYGKSKCLGEEAIREHCTHHFILRVSAVFSEYGNNFLKTMLRLGQEKKELRIVADQTTCPTDANDIARVIYLLSNRIFQQKASAGTYHYCGKEAVTWHQFATAIIETAKQYQPLAVEKIAAIAATDYPTPAKRPAYSVLDCKKIETQFGIEQMPLIHSIHHVVANLLKRTAA